MPSETLFRLQQLLESRKNLYRSVDLRIAAIKVDQQWYNCRSVALVSCVGSKEVFDKTVETESFAIFHSNFEAAALLDKVNSIIDSGKLRLGDEDICFSERTDKPVPLLYEKWPSRSSERSRERFGIEWPADYFQLKFRHPSENTRVGTLEKVDGELQCHDPPFESVYDVVKSYLNIDRNDFTYSANAQNSVLYLILTTYMRIVDCSLDRSEFEISIRFHKAIDIDSMKASVIGKGPVIRRKQLHFSKDDVVREDPFGILNKQTKLEKVSDLQVYLFLESEKPYFPADYKEIRNKSSEINLRLAAHEVFDQGSEKLLSRLTASERDSDRFEWAVVTLLHLCGFQTEWLGRKGMGEVPDLLAFHPEKDVLIVGECTMGVPDSNKILIFSERVDRLKQTTKMKTHAALFSNAKREQLQKIEVEPRIVMIGSEHIREIFAVASRGATTEEIYNQVFGYHKW